MMSRHRELEVLIVAIFHLMKCATSWNQFTLQLMDNAKADKIHRVETAASAYECAMSCLQSAQCTLISIKENENTTDMECHMSESNYFYSYAQGWKSGKVHPGWYKRPEEKMYILEPKLPTKQPDFTLTYTTVYDMLFSFVMTDTQLLVVSYNNVVALFDRATGSLVTGYPHTSIVNPWAGILDPDGTTAYVSVPTTNVIHKVTAAGSSVFINGNTDGVKRARDMAIVNGELWVICEWSYKVYFYNLQTRKLIGTMPTIPDGHYMCICSNGNFVTTHVYRNKIAMYSSGKVKLWEAYVSQPRGCTCDDAGNVIVTSREAGSNIYRVPYNGGNVTLYQNLPTSIPGFVGSHGPSNDVLVHNNTLYYLGVKGHIWAHYLP